MKGIKGKMSEEEKKIDSFLKELTELSIKHNIYIGYYEGYNCTFLYEFNKDKTENIFDGELYFSKENKYELYK